MAGEVDFIGHITVLIPGAPITIECSKMEGGHPTVETGAMSRNPRTGVTRARGSLQTPEPLSIEAELDLSVWVRRDELEGAAGAVRFEAMQFMVDPGVRSVAPGTRGKPFTGWWGSPDFGTMDVNGGDNTRWLVVECSVDGSAAEFTTIRPTAR